MMTKQEYLINVFMEECAEATQRAAKMLRFGIGDTSPIHPVPNDERFAAEVADLFAAIKMLQDEGVLPSTYPQEAVDKKIRQVEHFMERSRENGMLVRDFNQEAIAM